MRLSRAGGMIGALLLQGCAGPQSALHTAAPQARAILLLFIVFLAVSTLVWLGVALALGWGLARRRPERAQPLDLDPRAERARTIAVAALTTATAVIVAALSLLSYFAQVHVFAKDPAALPITVTGHQWWWEIEYESADPSQRFVAANELHVPVGQAVRVKLATADVIHSFWPPSLTGKIDLINNQDNEMQFTAERAGVYRGQCAEFCGEQHAHMGFEIVADPPAEFARWRAHQLAGAAADDSAGARVFQQRGCAFCHTVRGTLAGGRAGPDLTHVGGRRTIAAALLPRNVGNLAAWIADPQHFKPGVLMPAMRVTGADLTTLAAYLDNLK